MKRTAIIAVAVLLALGISGCNNIELTSPDMGAYRSQFAAERTAYPGGTPATFLLTGTNFSGTVNISAESTLEIDFSAGNNLTTAAISLDLLKYTKLEEFGPKLKEAVKISAYSTAGSGITPGTTSPLTYTVEKWEYPVATIKLTAGTVAAVEVELDREKWTHHGGMRLDLDNDGVIDEYDTQIFAFPAAGIVARNPRAGMGFSGFSSSGFTGTTGTFTSGSLSIGGNNLPDVSAKFNEIFGVEKFNRDSMTWEKAEVSGTFSGNAVVYAVTGGERDVFRMVIRDWGKARAFRTEDNYYGFKQKLSNTMSFPAGGAAVSGIAAMTAGTTNMVTQAFTLSSGINAPYKHPASGKDVVITVNVSLSSGGIGSAGLPDPKEAVEKGYIRLGYGGSGFASGTVSTWNNINFIPIKKAEAVDVGGTGQTNGWKLTLAEDYVFGTGGNNNCYLFISPDLKTPGDTGGGANPGTFGLYNNVSYVKDKVTQYQAYGITGTF